MKINPINYIKIAFTAASFKHMSLQMAWLTNIVESIAMLQPYSNNKFHKSMTTIIDQKSKPQFTIEIYYYIMYALFFFYAYFSYMNNAFVTHNHKSQLRYPFHSSKSNQYWLQNFIVAMCNRDVVEMGLGHEKKQPRISVEKAILGSVETGQL